MRIAFDSFEIDTDRCSVVRAGRTIGMRPQCYDLLLVLLERAGSIVGKDEIVNLVWKGLAVTDDSLTQCVSDLRTALGPDGAQLIRTVPRRGYMLDARVNPSNSAPTSQASAGHRQWLHLVVWATAAAFLSGAVVFGLGARWPDELRPPGPLLATTSSILGEPIAYPPGTPELIAGTLILAPGESSTWHAHPVPRFAYLLRGELLIDYGPRGTYRLVAGQGVVESVNVPHRGINVSDETAEVLYLSIGAESVLPTIDALAPPPVSAEPPLLTPPVNSAP